MELFNRLKQVRKWLRQSQTDMAVKLGIATSTYQHYERGEREIPSPILQKIVSFGFNPIWLLTGKGEMLYNTIYGSSQPVINQNIVADSFCESVRMLTLIYDKNRNLFETVMKYLKQAVGMLDIEEGLKDSDKKQ
jgi:transcriptional regulator with XRE-family HTH domain